MKIVIFCGGFGTRMWPASRKSFPKQFYPLVKGDSLFQLTVERFEKEFKPEDIFISTEARYISYVKKQAPRIPAKNIIAEPERRDNLAAIGLATAVLEKKFPGEVMLAAWSDHVIKRESEFLDAVKIAGDYAKQTGLIVSVDHEPAYPSTHLGWVKMGTTIDEIKKHRIVKIEKHLEKPDLAHAKLWFKSKNYLLNMGYLAWRTDVMLENYKKFQPEMYKGLMKIAKAWGSYLEKTELYREYHKFKKDSIDYGIFEKLPPSARVTIPVDVGWSDAGTWRLYYEAFVNGSPNLVEGAAHVEFIEAERNLVMGPKGKMIGVVGLSDIAVIDTPDGLLVCPLDKSGKVKDLFKKLEENYPEFVE
jgi:mannose-1-phosphate guanylyltransferase